VAVTTGAVGAPQDARTYTTAYVVGHVESALGAAAAADDIAYLHVPGNSSNMWFYAPLPRAGGAGIAQTHAPSGSTEVWLYNGPQGMITRIRDLSSRGQLRSDLEGSVTSAGTTITRVNYPAKTWSRLRYAGSPSVIPASCGGQIQVPLDLTAYYPPMLTK